MSTAQDLKSMFGNIVVYRIGSEWIAPELQQLQELLERGQFVPCAATQEQSAGWAAPRGDQGGCLVESVGGQWVLKLQTERKTVPGAAIRVELDARCLALENERGRRTGRKEKAELKEQIVHEFLPRAFSKRSAVTLWVDPFRGLLVIGARSRKAAEPSVKHLVDVMAALGHVMPLAPVNTATAPAAAMAHWLTTREAPAGFTIDRELELRAMGEERSVVRYARHTLDLDEIGEYIAQGMLPTRLAMTWNDRVSFVLTDQLDVRKIEMRDVQDAPDGEDRFDADVAIATGELSLMLPDLFDALGGEIA